MRKSYPGGTDERYRFVGLSYFEKRERIWERRIIRLEANLKAILLRLHEAEIQIESDRVDLATVEEFLGSGTTNALGNTLVTPAQHSEDL